MRLRIESKDMTWAGTEISVNGEPLRHVRGFDLRCRGGQINELTVYYTEPMAERVRPVPVELEKVGIELTRDELARVLRFLSRLSRVQAQDVFDTILGDEERPGS